MPRLVVAPAVHFAPPNGMAAVRKRYGAFRYIELSKGNVKIDGSWEQDNLVILRNVAGTGRAIQLHRLVAPLFEVCLARAVKRCPKYKVRMLGGFCARHKMNDPKRELSIHSWGAAFDVNWDTNGVGKGAKCDLLKEWVAAFTEQGWEWGGTWRPEADFMHFQYATGC